MQKATLRTFYVYFANARSLGSIEEQKWREWGVDSGRKKYRCSVDNVDKNWLRITPITPVIFKLKFVAKKCPLHSLLYLSSLGSSTFAMEEVRIDLQCARPGKGVPKQTNKNKVVTGNLW